MVSARHAVYPLHRMVLLLSILGCLTAAIWPKVPHQNWTPVPETSPANRPPSEAEKATSQKPAEPKVVKRLATSPGA